MKDPFFSAGEAADVVKRKAEQMCIGKSHAEIRAVLQAGPYKDFAIVDLRQDRPYNRRAIGTEVQMGDDLLHVHITHRRTLVRSLSTPRLSFFLRMANGRCRSVISVSEYAS